MANKSNSACLTLLVSKLGILPALKADQAKETTMQVHELVARLAKAGASSIPMQAVREELESLRGDIDSVDQALRFVAGTGGNTRQVSA